MSYLISADFLVCLYYFSTFVNPTPISRAAIQQSERVGVLSSHQPTRRVSNSSGSPQTLFYALVSQRLECGRDTAAPSRDIANYTFYFRVSRHDSIIARELCSWNLRRRVIGIPMVPVSHAIIIA